MYPVLPSSYYITVYPFCISIIFCRNILVELLNSSGWWGHFLQVDRSVISWAGGISVSRCSWRLAYCMYCPDILHSPFQLKIWPQLRWLIPVIVLISNAPMEGGPGAVRIARPRIYRREAAVDACIVAVILIAAASFLVRPGAGLVAPGAVVKLVNAFILCLHLLRCYIYFKWQLPYL